MNIVILTADERLYLPEFFQRFLAARAADTRAIFMAPTRYGKDSTLRMLQKYWRAFGFINVCQLAARTAWNRLADRFAGGRGGAFHSIPSVARQFGVHCESVDDVNADGFRQRLIDMNAELIISVSCPQIFKQPLIDLPPKGCLNMHGAMLPKYRGIAPSFWMMANGEEQAGVTVFFVTRSIDLGAVVEQEPFPILPHESLSEFIRRSKRISCDILLRAVQKIESGNCPTWALAEEGGSYFSFPTRQAYREFRRRGRRLW